MNSNIENHTFVMPTFLNSIGKPIGTRIIVDNILIVGSRSQWNHDVAELIKQASEDNGNKAEIISIEDFLPIPNDKKRDPNIFYIIVCNSNQISIEELSHAKDLTTTQILFKIPGLNLSDIGHGINISNLAKSFAEALGIKQDDAITLGLLASLASREFCVINTKNPCKRLLVKKKKKTKC